MPFQSEELGQRKNEIENLKRLWKYKNNAITALAKKALEFLKEKYESISQLDDAYKKFIGNNDEIQNSRDNFMAALAKSNVSLEDLEIHPGWKARFF